MRYLDMQSRIELAVQEAIEDIAEEIGVSVPKYPEVFWLGRKLKFENLFLAESYREDFEDMPSAKGSYYLDFPKMIFIGENNPEDITEESAHFLHYSHSNIRFTGKNVKDRLSLYILDEMLAFFCSKLLIPERKNPYKSEPDLFYMAEDNKEHFLDEIRRKNDLVIADEFFIYQQARGLGERMYTSYILGETPIEDVRDIFLSSFSKSGNATYKVAHLKLKYWPPKDKRIKEMVQGLIGARR